MGSGEANWQPETRESADHSLPFVMAVALMEGNLEIRHYDQMYYKRADVRALMQKNQRADRRRTHCRLAGSSLEHCRHRDEIRKSFSTKVAYHLGHFNRLMTDAEQERKFRPLAARCCQRGKLMNYSSACAAWKKLSRSAN
jgi:2-methylcitrate dehydratase